MAYFLFVDESGHDAKESPYMVLAGIAVEDRDVWNLITELAKLEEDCFGLRYSKEKEEIKGKDFLKTKVFRLAGQMENIEHDLRREQAKQCILHGESATRLQLTALAQAKLDYVRRTFETCSRYYCKIFASIVDPTAPKSQYRGLRKDYAYLFERFFYYLQDKPYTPQGIIVFDELEKMMSKILLEQMSEYFQKTQKGRLESNQIIPEPFFVHSDLSTLIQVVDLIAYTISWGFRLSNMQASARPELKEFAELIASMRYKTQVDIPGVSNYTIWSFAFIDDLRGINER